MININAHVIAAGLRRQVQRGVGRGPRAAGLDVDERRVRGEHLAGRLRYLFAELYDPPAPGWQPASQIIQAGSRQRF